jgi:hypothetical protein
VDLDHCASRIHLHLPSRTITLATLVNDVRSPRTEYPTKSCRSCTRLQAITSLLSWPVYAGVWCADPIHIVPLIRKFTLYSDEHTILTNHHPGLIAAGSLLCCMGEQRQSTWKQRPNEI